ncbi:YidB family protein [Photobacterium angustum]|uniref:DUF937 domain-containing protein n=1 Tax=Photobacterium angustum (strain S14 / CCUG 15956) TaxID=314292 RepID=Q1ZUL5_PHOAS|nr:YidB family protein [Photobacterium angustum]EAS66395.1 hypothetical protein VAS14_13799 [Photobacterium angustum S14]KJG16527.1 hypothetical protein UA33_14455 [Photobacterium angustum]KJG22644.1 hypothetical protein UA39_14265 [Photobacterium angustum]KJG29511.1 hypothetical protein UA36_15265 [Photobacterium angustum]PSW97882.1 hypothetical protein C0W79_06475 [Photobacterium angustum]
MDIAQILRIGAQLFAQSSANTEGLNENSIVSALARLLGGNSNGEGIDFNSLLQSLNGAGLANIVSSWLGNGENSPISADDIAKIFNQDQLSSFANDLQIPQEEAVTGLQETLPGIIDKASPNGDIASDLFQAVGGVDGIMNLASSLFGKK